METMELSELKYPHMRQELIDYVIGLSDTKYQYNAWVKNNRPEGGYDELDYAIHFLYDDTDLASDPDSLVGVILRSKDEVDAIVKLITALNIVFNKYGTELTDEDYLLKHEWEDVIIAAEHAKQILFNC